MSLKDLLAKAAQLNTSDLRSFINALERLPSESTLRQMNSTILSLVPYIPTLERMLGDGNLDKFLRMLERIPDKESIDKLTKLSVALDKIPDKATLDKLFVKIDSLQNFISSLEK